MTGGESEKAGYDCKIFCNLAKNFFILLNHVYWKTSKTKNQTPHFPLKKKKRQNKHLL